MGVLARLVCRVDQAVNEPKAPLLRTTELVSALPFMDRPDQLGDHINRLGYLFLPGVMPVNQVMALREVVLDYAEQVGWLATGSKRVQALACPGKRVGYYEDPDWVELQARVHDAAAMWDLGENEIIHDALRRASGGRASFLYLTTANTCRVFSPHADMATQPHQDAHYVNMLGELWTAWMPLGDCPRSLGPLAVLPGSHQRGLQPHGGVGIVDGGIAVAADETWHTTSFKCGDVLLFTWLTVHRSLPNISGDRLRLSVDFRYGFWDQIDSDGAP